MTFKVLRRRLCSTAFVALAALGFGSVVTLDDARASKIENPIAVFNGLDKITGRIIDFDVYIGETVQFGALQVTPRACFTRPETEAAKTTAFIEVDEVTLNNEVQRIFTGWMFAANPGVHAVEHGVYDIWLVNCKRYSEVPPPEGYSGPPVADAPEYDPLAGDDFISSGNIPIPRPNPFL
ncbi:DUF2155 domain-containing protein [Pseudovibrio exalbescens]|uniref:DUF2155 domain-containing protein n=1 Tax=Pseudovibrio exalbescens TaxID=197461 RepID=UPI002365BD09|nr:DUF2155 domain-containing protein [Pseudovibrio exalbescens]MDD7908472.1 DUF2155 domain-containing protein [Pseudovibrio exalbescens]